MRPVAAGLAIILLVVGYLLGWHSNRARTANGDIRTTKGRLPGFRRTRLNSAVFVLVLVVITLLIVHDFTSH